jgi:ribosomal protein L37E
MNRTNQETPAQTPIGTPAAPRGREPIALNCPACGAAARRIAALFCATCGRGLRERSYAPADSLLASYHQQRNRPPVLFEASGASAHVRGTARLRMFDNEGNTSAAIALVLVYSSLVPFIGILFCPLAVFAGGLGLFESWLVPRVGGTRLAACCTGFGFLIGGAQVLLFRLV